ncbi:MAG: substrate-binding domain-containing protein [Spirochaetaceae bacterium]|jgi:phosphate transport system substrate-binding protein|nr:substrate-binding domain-containing protein [Spirochaetaceae bacterium]
MKNALIPAMAVLLALNGWALGGKQASGSNPAVNVVSREEGSGTRSAFTELFEVLDGNKADNTTVNAEITNSTAVMMTTIAGDKNAVGYISLGSLNDTVKALRIDGAEATAANVANGSYRISRPFLIAIPAAVSEPARDFINYILSRDGQDVIEKNGYIRIEDTGPFVSSRASGKIVAAGSSSVTPVMEKLKEAYLRINSGADVEIQQSDSSTGMNAVIDGVCDIGMASREIKESEVQKGLTGTVIALDGIAVIVNRENPLSGLTKEQVRALFTGETAFWGEISQ